MLNSSKLTDVDVENISGEGSYCHTSRTGVSHCTLPDSIPSCPGKQLAMLAQGHRDSLSSLSSRAGETCKHGHELSYARPGIISCRTAGSAAETLVVALLEV
jgi:hypothetical protein